MVVVLMLDIAKWPVLCPPFFHSRMKMNIQNK